MNARPVGRRPLVAVLVLVVLTAGTGVAWLVSGPDECSRQRPAPIGSGPENAGSQADDLRPVSEWEERFGEQWARSEPEATQWSLAGDSWLHYRLGFHLDALDAMYRATGNTAYLDQALTLAENVASTARVSTSLPGSQYQDSYLGWESRSADTAGQEVPLYESVGWRYITSILRSMHQTGLDQDPQYAQRYDRLLAFAERNVFEKWDTRGRADNLYRSHTHMAAHWALIALNLASVTADDDTRRDDYRTVAGRIDDKLPNHGSSLRGQLRANPEDERAYFWEDEFGSFCQPGSDVAHANGVIAYVVEAESLRQGWTRADMTRFGLTLTEVIWRRGEPPAAYLDGSGQGTGWISDGFAKLGRYDAALQRRLEQYEPANAQFTANAALNVALLSGQQAEGVPPVRGTDASVRGEGEDR